MKTLRRASISAIVVAAFGTIVTCTAPPSVPIPSADRDVTPAWKALYADPSAAPPATYKQGHVTPSALKTVVAKRDNGFEIKLPGDFPIPTPAVYKDRLFVSGGFGTKAFFCFDAATGEPVWAVDLDDDGPSTAAVEDDVCVMNTESCTLFAVDVSTGKMLWSWWLGDPLMSAPTISKGVVYTSWPARTTANQDASHLLGAFDLKTGAILWQRWIDGDVISAPVASGDEIVAATFTGTVFTFTPKGSLVRALKARATSAPVVDADGMYFSRRSERSGSARETLSAWSQGRMVRQDAEREARYLDERVQRDSRLKAHGDTMDAGNGFTGGAPATAKSGEAAANVGQSNVQTLQSFQGSRILRLGTTNIACMGDEVACLDRAGAKQWAVKLPGDLALQGGFLAAPPVSAGGSLFIATLAGDVLQLEPAKGGTRNTWKLGHAMRFPPAVEKGRVYVGTQDGRVICIDTGDARNTGWAQWGGNAQRTGR